VSREILFTGTEAAPAAPRSTKFDAYASFAVGFADAVF